MNDILKSYPVTHAHLRTVRHPELDTDVNARSVVRYLRFLRQVRVERLDLGRVWSRAVPNIPAHPAHVTVSVWETETARWRTVADVDFPPDPDILGEGLTADTPHEEIEAHFARVLAGPPWVIPLGGVETDHLRVECDHEHPFWPAHCEYKGGGIFNVPFCTLDAVEAIGSDSGRTLVSPPYAPLLRQGDMVPSPPAGMTLEDRPETLLFKGPYLSIGFSLRRPLVLHLGWDALGKRGGANRINRFINYQTSSGLSGPLLRTLYQDAYPHHWTGEVSVRGNQVRYANLSLLPGVTVRATFTVEAHRILLELEQECEEALPVLEGEAWRLNWDMKAGLTGGAVMPSLRPGRSGDAPFPVLWTSSEGEGSLECRLLEGDPQTARLQVESYRAGGSREFPSFCSVTGGFVLAPPPEPEGLLTMPKGVTRATFELRPMRLAPRGVADGHEAPSAARKAVERHWSSVFSCYRPEYRGFSNNAVSVNCHNNQHFNIDLAAHTDNPGPGHRPLDWARFTIEMALLDGGGYGYFRELYLDSDPALVSSAGRIHQVDPNPEWLRRIEPGLLRAIERILGVIDESGLVVCRELSGNSGSFRWSSNAMDVVGFGHIDGYVNALTYRALRNAVALTADLGHPELSERCRAAAHGIRDGYQDALLNPATGWVAAWRSRDGQLHDHASLFVNGPALALGLIAPDQAATALANLEALRAEVGLASARCGLPINLLPIPDEDHMLPSIAGQINQTFELYTNGGLYAGMAFWYLRALALYGPHGAARRMAVELSEGYGAGTFTGPQGSGKEFLTWSGIPCGYEGTLITCLGPLYSIAVEFGMLKPTEPEWWPAHGQIKNSLPQGSS